MNLKELAANPNSWVSERAQIALDLRKQMNSGALSASEYQELMEDLVATDRLEAVADDIQLKAALVSAINIAAKLV